MERTNSSGNNFRRGFVLLLVVVVSALFLAVTWPFLKALLIGAILAGLCQPVYQWMKRLVGGRASLAAGLTLVLLFFVMVGPISALVGVVVSQALNVSNHAIPWVQQHLGGAGSFNAHDWLAQRFPALGDYIPSQEQLVDSVGAAAKAAGGFLVASASRMTAGTAAFLIDLFVMIYALFFFLRDGSRILEKIFYYTPLTHEDEVHVLQRFTSITRATVKGTLVIGLVQGALAGSGMWLAGIDAAAFWGTLIVVLSVVPGIGGALVWLPAVIYLFIAGHTMAGVLLFIWCAVVVSTIDNLLRPKLVGADAEMPDLLILIGTLGGLFLFGPIGFIVGPIVCGLFLTVWEIYGTTFEHALPPVRSLRPGELRRPRGELDLPNE
jgi:predicted PurR-regulated permease PerM